MRKPGLLVMMAVVTGLAILSASAPAQADIYLWCIQGRGVGYPGDCSYATYAQCMASASGRTNYCGLNPLASFARDRRGRPLYPDPYR
jgi:Protein of unknown function (DUF3551)